MGTVGEACSEVSADDRLSGAELSADGVGGCGCWVGPLGGGSGVGGLGVFGVGSDSPV